MNKVFQRVVKGSIMPINTTAAVITIYNQVPQQMRARGVEIISESVSKPLYDGCYLENKYFPAEFAFSSLTITMIIKDDEADLELMQQVTSGTFKSRLNEILSQHDTRMIIEDVSIDEREECEIKENFKELQRISRDAAYFDPLIVPPNPLKMIFYKVEKKQSEENGFKNEKLDKILEQSLSLIPVEAPLKDPETFCDELFRKNQERSTLSAVELFNFEKLNQRYLNEGNYKQAYILERKRYELIEKYGSGILHAPKLLQDFIKLLQGNNVDKSISAGNELFDLLSPLNESSDGILDYALLLGAENKPLESIFFNLLAANIYFRKRVIIAHSERALSESNVMQRIVGNVVVLALPALQEGVVSKAIFTGLLAPTLMVGIHEGLVHKITTSESYFNDQHWLSIMSQFLYVSVNYHACDAYKECKRYLKAAIVLCERLFGLKANQYSIYGICLHFLGFIFLEKHCFLEAKVYLKKADEALNSAKDEKEAIQKFNKQCLDICIEILFKPAADASEITKSALSS